MALFNIGFDEENQVEYNSGEELIDEELEERQAQEFKPKVDNRNREAYLSDRRIAWLKEEMEVVVVNEFGDEYHLTEEERREVNEYYDLFKKFQCYKHTYKKLDEYVTVVREALKILDVVAEENGIYDPDVFRKKFLKDKIEISGLFMPKYRGRDRKALNWKYVTDFILGDEDPADIMKHEDDVIMTPDEIDEASNIMFDEEELADMVRPLTDEEKLENVSTLVDYSDEDTELPFDVVRPLSRKDQKKLLKGNKELMMALKEQQRESRLTRNLAKYSYDLQEDDIDAIERANKKYGFKVKSDMPEFKGNITKSDDYYRYLHVLEEYEDTKILISYAGKAMTQEEANSYEIRQALESNGLNIRNMYDNKEREKRLKEITKENKRKEKEIKKRFLRMQERNKKRTEAVRKMGMDFDSETNKEIRRGKKLDKYLADDKKLKKSSGKKKKVKKEKGKNKILNKAISRSKESVDELLLAAVGDTAHGTVAELGEDVLDFTSEAWRV